MPHIILTFCCGVCLLNTTAISGQNLPKNPTPQQVISYRLYEQQTWNAKQLPRNSVLFKADRRYAGWQSLNFNFKKERQPVIDLSSIRPFSLQHNSLMNSSLSEHLPFLQRNLFQQKLWYNQWQKKSWLKDLQGSLWLREFLIQSKSKNNFHL